MNIALIGYGKMGQEIEQIILAEGKHRVMLKITIDNKSDLNVENLKNIDVAIEFSEPSIAFEHVLKCFEANIPIVVGTTSWLDKLEEAKTICLEKNQSLFVSPNYSIGVNLFFNLNKKLYSLIDAFDYQISMSEIHHTQKKDAPSGTAIQLAQDIIDISKTLDNWTLNPEKKLNSIPIDALREENVPGTHIVTYENDIDAISISHTAKNRKGFAIGAVRAAEFLVGKKGFYTMSDLLNL